MLNHVIFQLKVSDNILAKKFGQEIFFCITFYGASPGTSVGGTNIACSSLVSILFFTTFVVSIFCSFSIFEIGT